MWLSEEQKADREAEEATFQEPVRLIDCFMEIIGYTRYFLVQIESRPPEFEIVVNHYKRLFDRSQEKARQAKISTVEWKKGCFPVCACVDEMILCSNWQQKDKWRSHQLQLRYFKTTRAGEIFFSRLEKLKDKEKDVREVYLYCLSLGFKGRFFTEEEELHLAEIKTETLLKLFPEDETMSLPESLFPEGYIQQRAPKKGWKKGLSPVFLLILIVPPALIAALYVAFNLHLGHLTEIFTNTLNSRRVIVENQAVPLYLEGNQSGSSHTDEAGDR